MTCKFWSGKAAPILYYAGTELSTIIVVCNWLSSLCSVHASLHVGDVSTLY